MPCNAPNCAIATSNQMQVLDLLHVRALRLHVIKVAKDLQERQGPGATTSEAGRLQQHQLLLLRLLACLLDRAYGLLLQANVRRSLPPERCASAVRIPHAHLRTFPAKTCCLPWPAVCLGDNVIHDLRPQSHAEGRHLALQGQLSALEVVQSSVGDVRQSQACSSLR